jgi:hypothetical protein
MCLLTLATGMIELALCPLRMPQRTSAFTCQMPAYYAITKSDELPIEPALETAPSSHKIPACFSHVTRMLRFRVQIKVL